MELLDESMNFILLSACNSIQLIEIEKKNKETFLRYLLLGPFNFTSKQILRSQNFRIAQTILPLLHVIHSFTVSIP